MNSSEYKTKEIAPINQEIKSHIEYYYKMYYLLDSGINGFCIWRGKESTKYLGQDRRKEIEGRGSGRAGVD